MVIWKFPLQWQTEQEIEMPLNAQILAFQMQAEVPTIWAMVEPTLRRVNRHLSLVGTGEYASGKYIGTVQRGSYVFHLFDRHESPIHIQ